MAQWDLLIFHYINTQLVSSWADKAMMAASSVVFWLVIAGLVVGYIKSKTHTYHLLGFVVLLLLIVGLSDLLSSQVFKEIFARMRPCHALQGVRLIDGCGGDYGFPSGHATNSMTLITFCVLVFRHYSWSILAFLIPLVVAFSRIYLGVHYPSDVLAGLLLGSLVASGVYFGLGLMPRVKKWRDADFILQ